jgi:hypothetical protein
LKSGSSAQALEIIKDQRNNLAHGKSTLPLADIKRLVIESLKLDDWARIPAMDGGLELADWVPWIVTSPVTSRRTGLFERWQKDVICYLIPDTGEVFKVPRGQAG